MEFKLKEYGIDLVIVGPGLDAQSVEKIKQNLPADIRERVMGWLWSGRRALGGRAMHISVALVNFSVRQPQFSRVHNY